MRAPRLSQCAALGVSGVLSMGAYTCRIGPTPPVGTQGLQMPCITDLLEECRRVLLWRRALL